jgi:16S rRNA (adenine1518-N6/adenine1519-N6)-dimethyltransferase
VTRAPDTPTGVKAALAAAGLSPLKRFGQNFLVDPRVLDRVAAASGAGPGEATLEVGPGLGGLTTRLWESGAEVLAVEIDRGLAAHLRRQFADAPRFALVERDVLGRGPELADEVLDALAAARARAGGGGWRVASNLPYGITSPFLFALLDTPAGPPRRAVVMIQKEVGDVLVAAPGGDDYSVLSLAARTYWRVRRLFDVGPEAFFPRPDVDSCVVELEPATVAADAPPPRPFLAFARTLFQSRRKALRSSLRRARPDLEPAAVDAALDAAGLSPQDRVDGAAPERIVALYRALPAAAL